MAKPIYDFDGLDEDACKVMTAIVSIWVEKQNICQALNLSEEEAIWCLCGLIEKGFAEVLAKQGEDGEMEFWIEVDPDMMCLAKPTVH